MPNYTYRAVDNTGKPSEGTMAADTARDVIRALEEQGLTVNAVDLDVPPVAIDALELEPQEIRPSGRPVPRRERKLTWDDLKLFNEQVQAIAGSGLPLAPALKTLASDLTHSRLHPILEDIHQSLDRGDTLAAALDRHPESFTPIYRALVRAGERTGNLSGVFATLTIYSERTIELKNKLHETLAYPAFVFVVALVVAGYLLLEVLPGFDRRVMLDDSFAVHNKDSVVGIVYNLLLGIIAQRVPIAVAIVALPLAAVGLGWWMYRSGKGRPVLDAMLLRLPIIGPVVREVALARFSRALGLLLASRIPAPESLALAASAAGNERLRAGVTQATAWVEGGQALSDSLLASNAFPNAYCWLLHAAEERGSVDETLLHLAEQSERHVDKGSRLAVTMGGPFLITCSAVLVGFLFFAVYGVMYITLGTFLSGGAISGP